MRRLIPALALALATGCAFARPSAPELALRVMSYNIAAGHGDLDRIRETIRAANADLVALEEVDVHWHARSNFVDQAVTLGQQLGMEVCFAHIYRLPAAQPTQPPREYGVALLSR